MVPHTFLQDRVGNSYREIRQSNQVVLPFAPPIKGDYCSRSITDFCSNSNNVSAHVLPKKKGMCREGEAVQQRFTFCVLS
jgi:hypothetical protein